MSKSDNAHTENILSPTEIVCRSLSIEPVGETRAEHPSTCGVCGSPIKQGDWVSPMKFPSSFGLYNSLYDSSLPDRCGHCNAILETTNFLFELSSGVFTVDGFYPIHKKTNRAWMLDNLPEPPFVFAIQVNRSQHTVWRTPACYSRDLLTIRVGERLYDIRIPLLKEAAKQAHSIQRKWLSLQSEKRQQSKQNLPPVLGFSPLKNDGLGVGQIQKWVHKLVDDGQISESELSVFGQLNYAEAWALDFLLSDKEKPEARHEIPLKKSKDNT